MDRYRALVHIADGIQAGMRIRSVMASNNKSDERISIKDSGRANFKEILGILAQYSPESYRNSLNNTLLRSNQYSDAYNHIKRDITSAKTGNLNRDMLISTLEAIRPVTSVNKQSAIDKIVRIFEILSS